MQMDGYLSTVLYETEGVDQEEFGCVDRYLFTFYLSKLHICTCLFSHFDVVYTNFETCLLDVLYIVLIVQYACSCVNNIYCDTTAL